MSNYAKKLGANIRRIRTEKGMTQGDLCRKLKLDRSYVSHLEAGKKNPTLSTIVKVSQALGVKPGVLVK